MAKPGIALMSVAQQVQHVATLRAQGVPWRDITKRTGLSSPTISKRLKDDRAKEILTQAAQYHLLTLPVAIARHQDLIASDDGAIAAKAVQLQ